MAQVTLTAEERKLAGKGTLNELRRNGKVPAVFYGKNIENRTIAVDAKELHKLLKTHGEGVLIDLVLGGEKHTVIIKEIQRDALKGDITHVDFFRVSMTEKIEVDLPIVLKGEPEGVKAGGVLQHQLHELTIEALPADIPEQIEVDISHLQIGDVLMVKDIKLSDKITVIDDPGEVVVTVLAPTSGEELESTAGETNEPEVVAKGKEKEGE
ncbi:50S ribosomal protein L25/general stress protein Ctc [Thermosediminibacter oceani]|uniref:Large ribosomal subunit protein bL25 n=1 Tax=Thermosediminibacter oceani (strain ATCC BAA-1034 / DSM 16646 / JW/IW-1228P) TaxID=555079 RepID=D9RZE9_THEOJ|nr:50S ribosomal protein L25/general stress protein Ctc [Thermosediminibacter oceani]ADL06847.1 ribosomal 5S rRNA E-loop binding protein Ctc/L25/TL5 [Thermosediminibacter oceani DSM 16646]